MPGRWRQLDGSCLTDFDWSPPLAVTQEILPGTNFDCPRPGSHWLGTPRLSDVHSYFPSQTHSRRSEKRLRVLALNSRAHLFTELVLRWRLSELPLPPSGLHQSLSRVHVPAPCKSTGTSNPVSLLALTWLHIPAVLVALKPGRLIDRPNSTSFLYALPARLRSTPPQDYSQATSGKQVRVRRTFCGDLGCRISLAPASATPHC